MLGWLQVLGCLEVRGRKYVLRCLDDDEEEEDEGG